MILTLLAVVLIVGAVPVLTVLLLRRWPAFSFGRHEEEKGVDALSPEAFIWCLRHNQADITEIRPEDRDHEIVISFRYQGGIFLSVYNNDPDSPVYQTASISFFNCFEAEPVSHEVLRRVLNDFAFRNTPVKTTLTASEASDRMTVSLHVSGIRVRGTEADASFIQALLAIFFEARRLIASEFERVKAEEPDAVLQNIIPRQRAAYVMDRSEIESEINRWGGVWWQTPPLTLTNILDRLTGSMPSDSARIIVNGTRMEVAPSSFRPFELMIKADVKDADPILQRYLTIDVIEPDGLMNRNVHLIIRLTDVDERLITLHLYAMQSGLPVSAFRPAGSPETLPRAFSSALGIHRGGPEMFKAEAEYMAQEQNLIEQCRNGDAAYSFYYGSLLFASDRFFEAAHYLQNAYDIMAPSMGNPQTQPNETIEKFFDICFFLGLTYYKLGRYRDSYYFLDIIVNQHRVKWTEQYILTLVALGDPRLDSMLAGLKDQLTSGRDNEEDDSEPDHIQSLVRFIDRQQILVAVRQGKIDHARHALEKILEETPDDDFALHWLAKLG